ncbi:MAG: NADPH-dependent F420 reductase [Vicinamibacterales bacterium]
MRIAVVGAGNVGGALAAAWTRAGHAVTAADRQQPRLAALESEVVLVAVPGGVVEPVAMSLGDLGERVIIDATNVVGAGMPDGRTMAALRAHTRSPHVVKCFNTTGFENMQAPQYGTQALDMFVAGDSAHGKAVASALAQDAGFDQVWDVGGDAQVPLLEALALVWINIAIVQKRGRDLGFKLLRR